MVASVAYGLLLWFDSTEPHMTSLLIDIETYSDVDLSACGLYKYVESDNFKVLLLSYSIDGTQPEIVLYKIK